MSNIWHETKTKPPRMLDFTTQEDIDFNRHTKGLSDEVYISYMTHDEYLLSLGKPLDNSIVAEVEIPFDGPLRWRTLWGDGTQIQLKEPTYWRKKK